MRPRTALLLLAAALFAALGGLALAINTPALLHLDTVAEQYVTPHRSGPREADADGVFAFIGKPIHVLIPAVVFGGLFSLRDRSLRPLLAITGAIGAGVIIEETLKAVVTRAAATPELVDYPHSYPSGHVTGTAALLGMIAVCVGIGRSKAVRIMLAGLVALAVLGVALLAVYTGAHTVTDVIGGMVLGGAIVALGAAWLVHGVAHRGPVNSLA